MSTPPRSQGGGEEDLLWIIGGIFGVVVGLWFVAHSQISSFVMEVRRVEAYLMVFDQEGRAAVREWLASADPSQVTLAELWQSGVVAGRWLRFLCIAVVTVWFGWLFYRSPERGGRYNKSYTTASLAQQESALWKVIKPVLGRKIDEIPLDDPVHGMRARPRDYGRKHGFIVRASTLGVDGAAQKNVEAIDRRDVLLVDKAREVFVRQLGPRWPGIAGLKPHERFLFSAFAAQANNDVKLAQQVIDELAVSYVAAREAQDLSRLSSPTAVSALEKYGNTNVVQRVVAGHGYVRTVLPAMLKAARRNGVLPPNWFRWLKGVDRVTWYVLNDLGLYVASVEAAGPRSHFQAEEESNAPIFEPYIEPALVALRAYLEELIDEEELDE